QAEEETVLAGRARAKQAGNDERRYRDLGAKGGVSTSAYDQIKAAADSARAQLKAAKAQADVARDTLSYAILLADAD
ncbi:efflux RND transporter periplasmic adaptor subunit, partial [Xylella fastidiosa subsp. multiplex]|nr:efflux RND transporter periplasmic adaptor subunit [Xylella fastidiosa subsp. multiplex]